MAHLSNIQKAPPEVEVGSQPLALGQSERWFAARTLSYRENCAQFNVNRLGFRTFFPRVQRAVRHARKIRNVLAPLFPGYLFVTLDLSRDRWRSVNGAIGVTSLIMGADRPMPVPRGVIEALIATRENSGTVRVHQNLELGRRFVSCLDLSPTLFVGSSIWTTAVVFASSLKSWADRSPLILTGRP